MRQRPFRYLILIFLGASISIYSQSASNSKFQEMKNCFVLGLDEKGLEIASELLSKPEYSDVREEAVFYVAEFFWVLGVSTDDITNLSRAYTYYVVYSNDYPSSTYTDIVKKKILELESYYGDWILFRNLYDIYQNEAIIVEKKLSFATKTLYWFGNPDIYKFFQKIDVEQTSIELLNRYFDEIIKNHPEFEVYAYYFKILSRFSELYERGFFKEGLLKLNIETFTLKSGEEDFTSKGEEFKSQLESMLAPLSQRYPNHPLVLNLHLIYANIFMLIIDNKIDANTKKHLEFVVQNELDQTHPRYLLAKEFLLSNKFQ